MNKMSARDNLNKRLNTPKNTGSSKKSPTYLQRNSRKNKNYIGSKSGRLRYFLEFYELRDNEPELIRRIMRVKTRTLHAQIVNMMREFSKSESISMDEQINFNETLEKAMFKINAFTQKNIYGRELKRSGYNTKSEETSDYSHLKMYIEKIDVLTIGDKAKLHNRLKQMIKERKLKQMMSHE